MNRIGVQLILAPDDDQGLLQQCLDSLNNQTSIDVLQSPWVPGNVTEARMTAWDQLAVDHEWIGHIDPDDYVSPGYFDELEELTIEPGAGVVASDEQLINNEGKPLSIVSSAFGATSVSSKEIAKNHMLCHRTIVHRSALPYAKQIIGDEKFGVEYALTLAGLLVGEARKSNTAVYYWRQRLPARRHVGVPTWAEMVKRRSMRGDMLSGQTVQKQRPAQYDWDGIKNRFETLRQQLGIALA